MHQPPSAKEVAPSHPPTTYHLPHHALLHQRRHDLVLQHHHQAKGSDGHDSMLLPHASSPMSSSRGMPAMALSAAHLEDSDQVLDRVAQPHSDTVSWADTTQIETANVIDAWLDKQAQPQPAPLIRGLTRREALGYVVLLWHPIAHGEVQAQERTEQVRGVAAQHSLDLGW